MQVSPIWRHELTRQAGTSTLAFSGELDLACVPALQGLLFEQVHTAEVREVRVDLAEVTFLDSSALGVLVAGFHYAMDEGCQLMAVDPSPTARRVLALTGLDEVLISVWPLGAGLGREAACRLCDTSCFCNDPGASEGSKARETASVRDEARRLGVAELPGTSW